MLLCVGVPDADPADVAAKERLGGGGGGRGGQKARELLHHLLADYCWAKWAWTRAWRRCWAGW